MVTLRAHGGSCCGMRHIHSFSGQENNNPDLIDQALSQAINGQGVEVVLSGAQVESYPNVLERLAQLGFVLDGHWRNGNHGSQTDPRANPGTHNYRFTRADRREALNAGPIARRWRGMVLTPGLAGLLPMFSGTYTNRPAEREIAHYTRLIPTGHQTLEHRAGNGRRPPFSVGDTVRVTNARSVRNGREFAVLRCTYDRYDAAWKVTCHDADQGRDFSMLSGSFLLVRQGENVPERFVIPVGGRVQYLGHIHYNSAGRNGEYGTINQVHAGGQYVMITWDRPSLRAVLGAWIPTQFILLRDDNEAVREPIQPPALAVEPPVRVDHVHEENAEVLTHRLVPAREEVVAPQAATVLFRTYHNVYRDGRVGAGYESFDDAIDRRGRNGRVDRKEYLSDGSTRMVENVQAD